jgi:uncharacterized membrane protein YhiD involved in acid resistance
MACLAEGRYQHTPETIKVARMQFLDLVPRLLLAARLGAALGLEREYRKKPAGLRTISLIALGSALESYFERRAARDGKKAPVE